MLGSAVLNPEVLDDIAGLIQPEDFYDTAHEMVFRALTTIHQTNRRFDIVLLTDHLKSEDLYETVGGAKYLMQILNAVPNAAHAVYYAEIVRKHAIARRLIIGCTEILADAYDRASPVEELVARTESVAARISDSTITPQDTRSFSEAMFASMDALQARMDGTHQRLLDVGLDAFDNVMGLGPGGLTVVAGRPGMGKCLGRGTPILMHDGTVRPVETIRTGDKVMGPDSRPRVVTSTVTGREMMYRVDQAYGMTYRANGAHILMLKRIKAEKNQPLGMVREASIAEVVSRGKSFLTRWHGYKVGVDYDHAEQILEPYFIGLWLGDGTSQKPSITTADQEIVEYLKDYAARRGQCVSVMSFRKPNKAKQYSIISRRHDHYQWSMVATLRRLNLLGNKHIPRDYLIASREQRLKLMAGLVDSDGYYDKWSNCFEITMTDRLLVEQIKSLADGLGFRAVIKPKTAKCQNGKLSPAWRLRISGALEEVPVLLQRKRPTHRFGCNATRTATTSKLTITEDGEDEYFGFTLSGDGQFLLSDCTVTHNTAAAVRIARYLAREHKRVYFVTLEMTATELIERMLAAEARENYSLMAKGRINATQRQNITDHAMCMSSWPIFLDDSPSRNVPQIGATARRLTRRYGTLDAIIVDYLQLISPDNARDPRQEQVAKISRGLKLLARELKVPVICMAQVNRETEEAADKRPRLSHLRESGAIEQDADSVVFVHRPKYYTKEETPYMQPEEAELNVEKNRNGPTKRFEAMYFREWMSWENKAGPQFADQSQPAEERTTHF